MLRKLLGGSAIAALVCVAAYVSWNLPPVPVDAATQKDECATVDYQNGVYYFPCIDEYFGNALSRFKGEHPGMHVEAIASNGVGIYRIGAGFFVSFRTE